MGTLLCAAAQKAGLVVLPAICVTGNYAEIALIENLQRQDLTAVEEAEALLRLKEEQKYTDEQLAVVIGGSEDRQECSHRDCAEKTGAGDADGR